MRRSFCKIDGKSVQQKLFFMAISFIAAISPVVGGVGVINIMLVSIVEKTRKIGIRKVLGTKNKEIKQQFLLNPLYSFYLAEVWTEYGYGYMKEPYAESGVNEYVYPIGNAYQAENHIFQIRSELPAEIAIIQWQAMGPSEFSIFILYHTAAITETPEVYHNESLEYDESSMYWIFDELAEQIANQIYEIALTTLNEVQAYLDSEQTETV